MTRVAAVTMRSAMADPETNLARIAHWCPAIDSATMLSEVYTNVRVITVKESSSERLQVET
jgi:hypothetical protein